MGRVGGKDSFAEGRKDLEELAGIRVETKSVERVSEALGEQIECNSQREHDLALSDKLVGFPRVPSFYLALDGTGVPVVARETEGRKGKDPTGKAKTREAQLGCVFTQTKVEEEGYPVRDPESTTYVGAIETAEEFARRIYAEAVRRGVNRAARVIVLGDGDPASLRGRELSTVVRNYGDVFCSGSSRCSKSLGAETDHELCQILTGEGPLERSRGLLIASLESQ